VWARRPTAGAGQDHGDDRRHRVLNSLINAYTIGEVEFEQAR
jgi:hypothetical protein